MGYFHLADRFIFDLVLALATLIMSHTHTRTTSTVNLTELYRLSLKYSGIRRELDLLGFSTADVLYFLQQINQKALEISGETGKAALSNNNPGKCNDLQMAVKRSITRL